MTNYKCRYKNIEIVTTILRKRSYSLCLLSVKPMQVFLNFMNIIRGT